MAFCYLPRRPKRVVIREVFRHNLLHEFTLIQNAIVDFPFAAVDTEFPGVVHHPPSDRHYSALSPSEKYQNMKMNVDDLKLIQLGITLMDSHGNLPDFGSPTYYFIWQFNFQDFDVDRDLQNKDSINLLRTQGIDFTKNRQRGICSGDFARIFLKSALSSAASSSSGPVPKIATWVTFHGLSDFGYLIKILTDGKTLPGDLGSFTEQVRKYFGSFMDVKEMIKPLRGLSGGLERVAETLSVRRVSGRSHQAGSDSMLTMLVFWKLLRVYSRSGCDPEEVVEFFNNKLYGLDDDSFCFVLKEEFRSCLLLL